MDLADDVAYSVHDLEDGVVAGRIDLAWLGRRRARDVWETVRDWYLPDVADDELDDALGRLRGGRLLARPRRTTAAGGALAALKNLTSDLIGLFCTPGPATPPSRRTATGRWSATPPTWSCPRETEAGDRRAQGRRRALRDARRRPGRGAGAAARGGRRAGRRCSRLRGPATLDAGVRAPTSRPPRTTTRRGCGWSSTRSPRSPTPPRCLARPAVPAPDHGHCSSVSGTGGGPVMGSASRSSGRGDAARSTYAGPGDAQPDVSRRWRCCRLGLPARRRPWRRRVVGGHRVARGGRRATRRRRTPPATAEFADGDEAAAGGVRHGRGDVQ